MWMEARRHVGVEVRFDCYLSDRCLRRCPWSRQIINAFPLEGRGPYHGLSKFKEWIEGFDPVLDQV